MKESGICFIDKKKSESSLMLRGWSFLSSWDSWRMKSGSKCNSCISRRQLIIVGWGAVRTLMIFNRKLGVMARDSNSAKFHLITKWKKVKIFCNFNNRKRKWSIVLINQTVNLKKLIFSIQNQGSTIQTIKKIMNSKSKISKTILKPMLITLNSIHFTEMI